MYGSWDLEHNRQIFFFILDYFLPFYPPNNPENQNFEKMKKNIWRYHHFTQVYCKWQSYDLWLLRYEAQQTEFFLIWAIFCPFTPLSTQKIKILKKRKKSREILSFSTSVPQMTIIWYMVPEIWSVTARMFCHFGPFFYPFTPLTTQKIKILKKWKKHLEISSFYTCIPKIMLIRYTVPEIWQMMDVIVTFHFGLFFALLPS